jgi:hypothetical protein
MASGTELSVNQRFVGSSTIWSLSRRQNVSPRKTNPGSGSTLKREVAPQTWFWLLMPRRVVTSPPDYDVPFVRFWRQI